MLPPFAQLLFKAEPVPVCRLVFRSILNAAVAEVCRGKQRVFDIAAAEHLAAKRLGEHVSGSVQLPMHHRLFDPHDFSPEARQIADLVAAAHAGDDDVFVV